MSDQAAEPGTGRNRLSAMAMAMGVAGLAAALGGVGMLDMGTRIGVEGGIMLLVASLGLLAVALGGRPFGPAVEGPLDLSARLGLGLLGGALAGLFHGLLTEAAGTAGVARQTVSGWVNQDAVFVAELRNRAAELRTAAMARLEAAVPAALDALAGLLEHDDWCARVAAADRILRALDRLRPSLEPGEATPDSVRKSRERAEREAQSLADLLDSLTP